MRLQLFGGTLTMTLHAVSDLTVRHSHNDRLIRLEGRFVRLTIEEAEMAELTDKEVKLLTTRYAYAFTLDEVGKNAKFYLKRARRWEFLLHCRQLSVLQFQAFIRLTNSHHTDPVSGREAHELLKLLLGNSYRALRDSPAWQYSEDGFILNCVSSMGGYSDLTITVPQALKRLLRLHLTYLQKDEQQLAPLIRHLTIVGH